MISYKKFYDWEFNDIDNLYSIAIFYNSSSFMDLSENERVHFKNINKLTVCNLLFNVLSDLKSKEYVIRLRDKKFSWMPEFIKAKERDIRVLSYLKKQTWKKEKLYGEFKIQDIKSFLKLFLNYPYKYSYQDIIIQVVKSNTLVVISNHGSMWVVSDNLSYLKSVSVLFKKAGTLVKFSNNVLGS